MASKVVDDETGSGKTPPRVEVDYERYAHFLDDADLTEDQKRDCIAALWNIMMQFAAWGYGLHPVQTGFPSCGKAKECADETGFSLPDMLDLNLSETGETKNKDADRKSDAADAGVRP